MAVGYEGLAIVDGVQLLCTGASVSDSRQRLDSNSGWRGSFDNESPTFGMNVPRIYDYSINDGTVSFEVGDGVIQLLKSWILNRKVPKEIIIYPCNGAFQRFSRCYWTSIELSSDASSIVTGTINFMSMKRDQEVLGGSAYINNRNGLLNSLGLVDNFKYSWYIQNYGVVPGWRTTVRGLQSNSSVDLKLGITTWSLSFGQEFTRYYTCEANMSPQEATYLGVSAMTATLNTDIFVDNLTIDVNDTSNRVVIDIGGITSFTFTDIEVQEHSQNIVGQSDLTTIPVQYQIFGMSAA